MGLGRRGRTEHAGAKKRGGRWGHRAEVKVASNKERRRRDRQEIDAADDRAS